MAVSRAHHTDKVDPAAVTRAILDESRALGFPLAGVAAVAPAARWKLYRDWLAAGHAGAMAYLHGVDPGSDARADVRRLFPPARAIATVALAHAAPDGAPLVPLRLGPGSGPRGRIAAYAGGTDYHLVLKARLRALAERLEARLGRPVAARPCVDTAPVLERELAERAGLGFIGKNTMLIAPGLGSYLLLGELLLDVEAQPTPAPAESRPRCGSCRACLDACPTGAFVADHVLDARRCVSYLTIENPGPIPVELRAGVGTRIFGCDVCQEVCPFNARPERAPADAALVPRGPERTAPQLIALLALGAAQFRRFIKRSALRRVTRERLLRNVCVALGNAGDPAAVPALRRALVVEKSALVRAHAAWALGKLGDAAHLQACLGRETDPAVREELVRWTGSG
jgi:epoxyqueuosine reductase